MERFHNIFGHPHELIVRGGWTCALRHRVANGVCGVAKTGWEHYRGALDEVFQRERVVEPPEIAHLRRHLSATRH